MRRAIARGRVFPQNYSTDRRYGRLSLKAVALFPLMWVNADDQGRLCGDPEEIKYAVCPNIDHLTKADIPILLKELQDNKLILWYNTSKSKAVQIIDWWDTHRAPQWAWPSDYPPPEGWQDHLRYKKDAKTVLKFNWPISGEGMISSQVSTKNNSGEDTLQKEGSEERDLEKDNGNGDGSRRGRGNSPEYSGEKTSSSPTVSHTKLFNKLNEAFTYGWGHIDSANLDNVIPRRPDAREYAQLRDLADELSSSGGCPLEYIDQAFRDAAGRPGKMKVSYVRAILLDWLGIQKEHPP